jgi:triosephosphate isomerase
MFLVLACANKCVSGFTEVVVSPPYVFLPFVKSLLRSDFHVAAQNAWVSKGGAYTGEIRYIIHSCLFNLFVLHLVLLAMT